MRIAINLLDVTPGRNGGMEVYIRSLIHQFDRDSSDETIFLIGHKDVLDTFETRYTQKIFVNEYLFHNTNIEKVLLDIIETYDFDVWFCPMLSLFPLKPGIPSAVTIPDLQHEHFPQFFDTNTLEWRNTQMKSGATLANRVFTLSKASKEDLVKFYNIKPSSVVITYLDAPPSIKKKKLVKLNFALPKKFLFYPANTWEHKNHLALIEAFKKVSSRFPDIHLIFTGYETEHAKTLRERINELQLESKVHFLGYLAKDEVATVFRKAKALVYPTLFEGFGIPIVEAFNLGIPVLSSSHNTSKEIAGRAAIFFDPQSSEDIANKIILFLSEPKISKELTQLGKREALKFNYKKTADATLRVLKQIGRHKKVKKESHLKIYPRISIVMPTYNQAKFIERSILSVLNQDYPNFELIVMDGGSKDGTLKILKKYANKITYRSEKDNGQTDAINKGMALATGDILAYLNSDDTYEPKTFYKVASFFSDNPKTKILYGLGKYIDTQDRYLRAYPTALVDRRTLFYECGICQPTVFFTRKLFQEVGLFNVEARHTMDYEYWIRVSKENKFSFLNKYLANYRLHPASKTNSLQQHIYEELIQVSHKHYGKVSYNWLIGRYYVNLFNKPNQPKSEQIMNYLTTIPKSFLEYVRYNRQFPEIRVLKIYLSWLRECGRILKSSFVSNI